MSKRKKEIRRKFRDAVFGRDRHTCRVCGQRFAEDELDAHHITDRNLMPNGGYVLQNGITVCLPCHERVEEWHRSGNTSVEDGLHPDDLYEIIGSSYQEAVESSKKLR